MKNGEQPIGVFDSGVGGLTVARAIQTKLPYESVVYFGDRARCPYGDLSTEDVTRYAVEIAQFLLEQRVKCIVVACNTATAAALPTLQRMFSVPVLGVIKPGAHAAVTASQSGKIGVIGTSVTIGSHAYQTAIRELAPDIEVYEHACPAFVPLVEQGLFDGAVVEHTVRTSLEVFKSTEIDTLVLGCTHYPLLAGVIRRAMGPAVSVISSADATASAVESMLAAREMQNRSLAMPTHTYFTTGDGSKMRLALANWFSASVKAEAVTQVTLPLSSRQEIQRVIVQ